VRHERLQGVVGGGNVVYAQLTFEHITEVVTSVGDRGKSPKAVVSEVVDGVAAFMTDACPVDEYLADQLLLPMALAAGGRFRAASASLHLLTNAEIINRFLGDGTVVIESTPGGSAVVTVVGRFETVRGNKRPRLAASAAAGVDATGDATTVSGHELDGTTLSEAKKGVDRSGSDLLSAGAPALAAASCPAEVAESDAGGTGTSI
jgi:hypothetical protein